MTQETDGNNYEEQGLWKVLLRNVCDLKQF